MPPGVPYIVGNEAAERFSYYGMRTILVMFMTEYLLSRSESGLVRDVMSETEATFWYHLFTSSAYLFPILGAIVADAFLGKYLTILSLSIVYCLGHLALALDETRLGLAVGLTLIAIGSGGIKPCVSAHVGDQFGQLNKHLLPRVFGWFYFAINLGAFASSLLTPVLLQRFGPHVAFGVPGALMFLATWVFWLGRHKFVHVPPGGWQSVREALSADGLRALANLVPVYVFVAMFWSLFDQSGSAWVLQAKRMDLQWLGITWLPSQVQAFNPLLILVLIPLFAYVIYPAIDRVFPLTPLRKVSMGMFVAAAAFALSTWIESEITGGRVVAASSEGDENRDAERWGAGNLLDGARGHSGWVSASQSRLAQRGQVLFPQEIVLRLRERRAWAIDRVRIDTATQLEAFLMEKHRQQQESPGGLAGAAGDSAQRQTPPVGAPASPDWTAASRRCRARHVDVYVGRTRRGDPSHEVAAADKWSLAAERAAPQGAALALRVALGGGSQPAAVHLAATPWLAQVQQVHSAPFLWVRRVVRAELQPVPGWQEFGFAAVQAEYVRLVVQSNWGGDYVTLSEVEVLAAAPLPDDAHRHAAQVWPNVAAIGYRPSIVWQLWATFIITCAEVMISITCLEFSYTQAPNRMKSFIMSLYLASVWLGNIFTAGVNYAIETPDGGSRLDGPAYYGFFTLAMLAAALLFVLVARNYQGRAYIQDEEA